MEKEELKKLCVNLARTLNIRYFAPYDMQLKGFCETKPFTTEIYVYVVTEQGRYGWNNLRHFFLGADESTYAKYETVFDLIADNTGCLASLKGKKFSSFEELALTLETYDLLDTGNWRMPETA